MKKWTIALLAVLLAAGSAAAQAKGTTKTPEPPKPAAAPEPARPAEAPRTTAAGPRAGTIGAQASWTGQTADIGMSYYLASELELTASLSFALSGATQKDNLASTSLDSSAPSLTLLTAAMFENRVTAQTTWGWGPLVGIKAEGSEVKQGGKENKGSFDLYLGGGADVKYYVAPNVALFASARLLLDWTLSNTDVITNAAGTKTKDESLSGLSLSTGTSAIGVAVYLN